ncbi:MAG: hypothetical protein AB2765_07905 [Candidatus Thiodiazotropha endolucinida]
MPDDQKTDANQIRDQLRQEIRRTRLSPEQLSQLLSEHAGITLLPEQIRKAIRKNSKAIATPEWRKVLAALKGLPDAPKATRGLSGYNTSEKGYIEITREMARHLSAEIERTGANISLIVAQKPPEMMTLTKNRISTWKTGRIRKANPDEWGYVISTLNAMPDQKK